MSDWNDTDIHTFTCEVCDIVEETTDQKAFDAGWDYPPFMGAWGVVSPRTCPHCAMTDTAWWAAMMNGDPITDKQRLYWETAIATERALGLVHFDD